MLTKQEAAEWADALDSGRYEQSNAVYCVSSLGPDFNAPIIHRWCCIAVKADLDGISHIDVENGVYPKGLEWINIDCLDNDHEAEFFVVLNDNLQYDFPQIAQIIRQRYLVEVE